ncbi:DUF7503 family protein [Haladaptatus halobius]|jgi:hypothetical protein|nr:hypothetical protein [Haladaptatus halobius]
MARKNAMGDYLATYPRMIGALFALSVALMHAGNVLANAGGSEGGP